MKLQINVFNFNSISVKRKLCHAQSCHRRQCYLNDIGHSSYLGRHSSQLWSVSSVDNCKIRCIYYTGGYYSCSQRSTQAFQFGKLSAVLSPTNQIGNDSRGVGLTRRRRVQHWTALRLTQSVKNNNQQLPQQQETLGTCRSLWQTLQHVTSKKCGLKCIIRAKERKRVNLSTRIDSFPKCLWEGIW